jgi:protein involved in polysaccharide export with SLBB domain
MLDKIKLPDKDETVVEDNGINPDTYIIGHGDQLTAYAINSPAVIFIGQVTLEADVFIPEVGLIKVGPKTLTETIEIINRKLIETVKGKNVEFFTSLTKIKSPTFTIGGSVLKPGTYTMRGKYRIFDAIEKANADSNIRSIPNVNLREVLLINCNDTTILDLYDFLYKNNLMANPYLYPGQNIFVSYKTSKIRLDGPIINGLTGEMPIRKNESLKSILDLCIFDESADKSSILVKKAVTEEIIQTDYDHSDTIILEDFDQVTVLKKPLYPLFQTVAIRGEISRPGNYSINNKKTTLKNLMEMAGGITGNADFKRSCIIRRKNNPGENLTSINPSISLSIYPEIQTSLRKMNSLKDYSILRLDSEQDSVLLLEDDIIYIPKTDPNVYVSGNVSLPGVVGFSNTKTINEYIKAAGGLANGGDKSNAYVLTVYPENIMVIKDRKKIEPGDIIVVPEKQKYRIFSTVFIPILSAVLTTISTAWMIYSNSK